MKFLSTGRLRVVNGMWKTIENGKQKIQIDSSMTWRRPKMIKWIQTKLKKFWNYLTNDDKV